jgi:hypothetical protein
MKKITIVATLLMAMAFTACKSGSTESAPTQIAATVQMFNGDGSSFVHWAPNTTLVAWDETFNPVEVTVASVAEDTASCMLQLADTAAPSGVSRFVYPANAYVGNGMVNIPTVQQRSALTEDLLYYAEPREGKVDFLPLCGLIQLHVTTPEQLASITLSTTDSLLYFSGNFTVREYPIPVIDAAEGAEHQVTLQGIDQIDFSQGADVFIQVAPGYCESFQVVFQNKDGKKCTKTLKEDKSILIERGKISSVALGDASHPLVFE